MCRPRPAALSELGHDQQLSSIPGSTTSTTRGPSVSKLHRRFTEPSFSTPMSAISAMSTPLSTISNPNRKEEVTVEMSAECLRSEMVQEIEPWAPGRSLPRAVAERLLQMVALRARGGTLIVHAPSDQLSEIQAETTDRKYLETRLKRDCISNIVDHGAEFAQVLSDFSEHSVGDRWPMDHADNAARGMPKDGGFAISATGIIRGAARKFHSDVEKLPFGWAGKGLRHTTALAIGYYLSHCVIFVRSDGGDIHVVTSRSAKAGVVFSVKIRNADMWLQHRHNRLERSVTNHKLGSGEIIPNTHTTGHYWCEVANCNRSFASLTHLLDHMKRRHPDDLAAQDRSPTKSSKS